MQSFNSELKVGMQDMIIGTGNPKNSWLIGSVVTVEEFWKVGQDVTDAYIGVREAGFNVVASDKCIALVLVSGCNRTGTTASGNFHMKAGFANLQEKNLMPLPPLDDDAIIESTETPKETSKC